MRFDNVKFAYDPNRPFLKGVSFEVPAGKTVAIFCPSGAGKSTLFKAIMGLVPLAKGDITLLGMPVKTALRGGLGLFPVLINADRGDLLLHLRVAVRMLL